MAIAVGKVLDLSGIVQVYNPETGEIRTLDVNGEIFHDEVILANEGAYVAVDMIDGNTITLGSSSTLTIDDEVIPAAAVADVSDNAITFESLQKAVLEGRLDSVTDDGRTLSDDQLATIQARVDALTAGAKIQEEPEQSSQEGVQEERTASEGEVTAGYETLVVNPAFVRDQEELGRDEVVIIPELTFSGQPVVVEGNQATYTLTLDIAPTLPFVVTVNVANQTTQTNDLDLSTQTITFAPGETTQTFTIQTNDDIFADNAEIYQVSVANTQGGGIQNNPMRHYRIKQNNQQFSVFCLLFG